MRSLDREDMAVRTVGGVRRRGDQGMFEGEVSLLTNGVEGEKVAAVIAVVYGLLRLRSTLPDTARPKEAAWFERRETRGHALSWRARSLAASAGRGFRRA